MVLASAYLQDPRGNASLEVLRAWPVTVLFYPINTLPQLRTLSCCGALRLCGWVATLCDCFH